MGLAILFFLIAGLALFAAYVKVAYVATPAGSFTIVGDIGGKPLFILGPGWKILWGYPMRKVLLTGRNDLVNKDLPSFHITCLIDTPAPGEKLDLQIHGAVVLDSGKIQYSYKVREPRKDNEKEFQLFFQQYEIEKEEDKKTGKVRYFLNPKDVEERLSALVMEKIKEQTARLGILDAISSQANIANNVLKEVRKHTVDTKGDDEELMVTFTSLNIAQPFSPADPETAKGLAKKSQAAVELSAAKEAMKKKIFEAAKEVEVAEQETLRRRKIAEGEVEIAKFEADALAARLRAKLNAFGKDLDDKERAQILQNLEAIEALKVMNGSKVVVSSNLLAEAKAIIGSFFGGK